MTKLEELKQNIGKKCFVWHTSVASLPNRPATIKDVIGNEKNGYQYHIELDEDLYPNISENAPESFKSYSRKRDFYPYHKCVTILE